MSLFANALKLSSRGRSFSFHNSYLSSYEMSRVITKSDVEKFAVVSGDTNPIHFEGDNPIVHGALLISIISGIIGTKCPGKVKVVSLESKFLSPCPVGSKVRFNVEILSDRKIIQVGFQCSRDDPVVSVRLMEGTAKLVR